MIAISKFLRKNLKGCCRDNFLKTGTTVTEYTFRDNHGQNGTLGIYAIWNNVEGFRLFEIVFLLVKFLFVDI